MTDFDIKVMLLNDAYCQVQWFNRVPAQTQQTPIKLTIEGHQMAFIPQKLRINQRLTTLNPKSPRQHKASHFDINTTQADSVKTRKKTSAMSSAGTPTSPPHIYSLFESVNIHTTERSPYNTALRLQTRRSVYLSNLLYLTVVPITASPQQHTHESILIWLSE